MTENPIPLPRKEVRISPEQQQFFNRYQQEAKKANDAERSANQHARDRMQQLDAPTLRKIGAKQLVWGFGLSFINGVGMAVGAVGGAWGVGTLVAAVGASAFAVFNSAWIAGGVGLVGGAVAGAELVRVVYEKFARKLDTSLPKLDQTDRILGDVFAVSGWTPPMIAGVRNIFDGYNNMKSIQ
jgi:hypothetical protein